MTTNLFILDFSKTHNRMSSKMPYPKIPVLFEEHIPDDLKSPITIEEYLERFGTQYPQILLQAIYKPNTINDHFPAIHPVEITRMYSILCLNSISAEMIEVAKGMNLADILYLFAYIGLKNMEDVDINNVSYFYFIFDQEVARQQLCDHFRIRKGKTEEELSQLSFEELGNMLSHNYKK